MTANYSTLRLIVIVVLVFTIFSVSEAFIGVTFSQRHKPTFRVLMSETVTTPLVANGKRFEAVPGSSLMMACSKLGLKVPTDCKKGECGTCTVSVGGQKIKACVGKVPPAPRLKSLKEKGLQVIVDN